VRPGGARTGHENQGGQGPSSEARPGAGTMRLWSCGGGCEDTGPAECITVQDDGGQCQSA
jgi:hypothetical protein